MLSSSSKYALRTLMYLAEQKTDDFLPVKRVAKAAKIPPAYLSKLVKILGDHGILKTRRGKEGGIRLGKKTTSFYEICQVLEDPVLVEHCILSDTRCKKNNPCPLHDKWFKERGKIEKFLKTMKIKA